MKVKHYYILTCNNNLIKNSPNSAVTIFASHVSKNVECCNVQYTKSSTKPLSTKDAVKSDS